MHIIRLLWLMDGYFHINREYLKLLNILILYFIDKNNNLINIVNDTCELDVRSIEHKIWAEYILSHKTFVYIRWKCISHATYKASKKQWPKLSPLSFSFLLH